MPEIDLNRKILADMAMSDPAAFGALVVQVKAAAPPEKKPEAGTLEKPQAGAPEKAPKTRTPKAVKPEAPAREKTPV